MIGQMAMQAALRDELRAVRQPESFEETLSLLTFAIASVERLKGLDPGQLDRLRQAGIRLANASIRHNKLAKAESAK